LDELVGRSDHDNAVKLAKDLRDIAARDGDIAQFRVRFEKLRERHRRRWGFFSRWNAAHGASR
jgi:hypothetical protein